MFLFFEYLNIIKTSKRFSIYHNSDYLKFKNNIFYGLSPNVGLLLSRMYYLINRIIIQ